MLEILRALKRSKAHNAVYSCSLLTLGAAQPITELDGCTPSLSSQHSLDPHIQLWWMCLFCPAVAHSTTGRRGGCLGGSCFPCFVSPWL